MAMNSSLPHAGPPDHHEAPYRLPVAVKRSLLGTLVFAAAASAWIAVDVHAQNEQIAPAVETAVTDTPMNEKGEPVQVAVADENTPSTRPADAPADGPRRRRFGPGGGGPGGGPMLGPGMRERTLGEFRGGDFRGDPASAPVRQDPPTDDEWKQIAAFAQENLPNRMKMFNDVVAARGEDAPVVKNIKQRLAVRYRSLQRTQSASPRFYQQAIDQVRLEDDVWGAVRAYKADPQNESLRSEVRTKVQTLVQSLLEERSVRVERMKQFLEVEEAQLAESRENIDSVVDNQMKMMLNERPAGDEDGDNASPPQGERRRFGSREGGGDPRRGFDRDGGQGGGNQPGN